MNMPGLNRRLAIIALALSFGASVAQSAETMVSWGAESNDPTWNEQLGITGSRQGCSLAPSACVAAFRKLESDPRISSIFVAIPQDSSSAIESAAQYSALSLSHPKITEIGFDDFVSHNNKLDVDDKAGFLRQVIAALRSKNSQLKFGITVYENELNSQAITELPAALRGQINFVHLFLHYRADGPNFPSYVQTVHELFPNAQILGGVYPVDRIDRIECNGRGSGPCSQAEEMSLFQQAFVTELQMLRRGEIAGLEFFPGQFGHEDQLRIWPNPKECNPSRLPQCIANTRQMVDFVRRNLQSR